MPFVALESEDLAELFLSVKFTGPQLSPSAEF